MTAPLNKLFRNEFVKDVLTLLTGTSIAQLITICMIPVLSRIYTPSQFGEYSLLISIAGVGAVISALRYELAIMLPRERINAYNIFYISVIFVLIFSFFILMVMLVCGKSVAHLLNSKGSLTWTLFLPLAVLFLGLQQVFVNWMTRNKRFPVLSKTKIVQSMAASAVFITMGLMGFGVRGLLGGFVAGHLVSTVIILSVIYRRDKDLHRHLSRDLIKTELRENRNFPYYSMPMGFLNTISQQLLLFILNFISNPVMVGLYAKANRASRLPLALISLSFSSVFYQKLSTTGRKPRLYLLSFITNMVIGLVLLFPVMVWGEEIFTFVLGSRWTGAGTIARIISPLTVCGFAAGSVSAAFAVSKKNQILLLWQIAYLAIGLLIIYLKSNCTLNTILLYFSIFGAAMYLLLALLGYYVTTLIRDE